MRVLLIALALAGCATGYGPQGFSGGFSEMQVAEDTFAVTFNGNGFTSPQQVSEMLMLRSAELTLLNGKRFFRIADSVSEVNVHRSYTPAQATSHSQVAVAGPYAYGQSTTDYTGPQVTEWFKPSSANLIVMSAEKPEGMAFDAALICRSLSAKYKVACP